MWVREETANGCDTFSGLTRGFNQHGEDIFPNLLPCTNIYSNNTVPFIWDPKQPDQQPQLQVIWKRTLSRSDRDLSGRHGYAPH